MENTIDKIIATDFCPGATVDVEMEFFKEGEGGKPEPIMVEVVVSIPNVSQTDLMFDMLAQKDFSRLKKYIFKNFISFPSSGQRKKYDQLSKDETYRIVEFGVNVVTP